MPSPLRSEAEAFRLVVAIAAVALVTGLAGWFGGAWAGLGAFALAVLAVLLYRRRRPRPDEPAVWQRPSGSP